MEDLGMPGEVAIKQDHRVYLARVTPFGECASLTTATAAPRRARRLEQAR